MHRSVLAVPALKQEMHTKALASPANGVFLDLEDSVAPQEKAAARLQAAETLRTGDWQGRDRVYRINGVGTPWWLGDLEEVMASVGDAIDRIIAPRIDSLVDIARIDEVLSRLEARHHLTKQIGIECQIETAKGLVNVDAIAASGGRLYSLIFGPGDFAASAGIPAANIGTINEWDVAYGQHRWHYPLMRIVVAAHAFGLLAIDGPYAALRDVTGLRRSAVQSRSLGFDGKWCIHPAQIDTVNDVFSRTDQELDWATRVVDAYQKATAAGEGAVSLDGQMLDMASVRLAMRTLEISE